jgi:hypothetical protein
MANDQQRRPTPQQPFAAQTGSSKPVRLDIARAIKTFAQGSSDFETRQVAFSKGQELIREGYAYTDACAFLVTDGELHEQQTSYVPGKGHVTITVAQIKPGGVAFVQALSPQYAGQPTDIAVMAATEGTAFLITPEWLRKFGELGEIINAEVGVRRQLYRALTESRKNLPDIQGATQIGDGLLKFLRVFNEKSGTAYDTKTLMRVLWDTYRQKPDLDIALQEKAAAVATLSLELERNAERISQLETRIRERDAQLREGEVNAFNFAQTYTLLTDEKKEVEAQLKTAEEAISAQRKQLREERAASKAAAELAKAAFGQDIKDVYDAMEERAKGANMYLQRIMDLLRKRGLPLVLLEQTPEELDLLRTRPKERNVTEQESADAEDPLSSDGLIESDEPADLRQTSPGFRMPAELGPFAPPNPSPSEHPTIPVPLMRPASDVPKKLRPDSISMPSTQGSERKPTAQKTSRWDSQKIIEARDAALRSSKIPRPPLKPREETFENPRLGQTADWSQPETVRSGSSQPPEDDALDSGRGTLIYAEASFADDPPQGTPFPKPPAVGSLRRETYVGVPFADKPPKKR